MEYFHLKLYLISMQPPVAISHSQEIQNSEILMNTTLYNGSMQHLCVMKLQVIQLGPSIISAQPIYYPTCHCLFQTPYGFDSVLMYFDTIGRLSLSLLTLLNRVLGTMCFIVGNYWRSIFQRRYNFVTAVNYLKSIINNIIIIFSFQGL